MRLLAGLLALLLFLCMAHPCAGASGREMVVVFKGGQTDVPFKEKNGAITKIKPLSFRLPAFVGGVFNGKEFLMAFCDADYKGYSDRIFIAPAVKTSYGNYTTWSDADVIAKTTRNNEKQSVLGDATAVMKGNKIYVLVSSWEKKSGCWYSKRGGAGWDPLMIVGTVKNFTETDGTAGVYVQWDNQGTSLKSLLPNRVLRSSGLRFIGGLGNGIITKNGTIIFPIQIANKRSQYVSSIMYSTDDGSSWHIGGMTEEGTSQCSVAEWGNGKLLLSASYDFGFRKFYESDDMGTTWKESTMLSQVWGNQQYRLGVRSQGSLITASVDREDVLLFSQRINTGGDYKRDTLQLWMSNGQRIKFVGTISENGKGELSGYSILAHVGNHLYIMHEVNPYGEWSKYNATLEEWDRVIALTPLPDLFKIVKNTARAWRHVDDQLKNKSVPTNGLVGFLAGSNDNTVWEDEYNSVNATVRGATPVQGGFSFNGKAGSGAQWRVESQRQNQLYIFTKKQFTIAATVTIDEFQKYGNNWLLGASEDEAGTRSVIGLGYIQDERWYVVYSGGIFRNNNVKVEMHKEYHLAITYDKGAFDVYVNGESIMNWKRTTYKESRIRHFYIGGLTKYPRANGFVCTVKHVLLYNRALNKTEIDEMKNVDKYVHQDIPMISTEQTDTVVAPTSSSATQYKDTSMSLESKPEATLEYSTSSSDTKNKDTLISSKSEPNDTIKDSELLTKLQNKGTTDPVSHETPPKDIKDKPVISTEQTDTAINPKPSSATQYKGTSMGSETNPKVTLEDSESPPTTNHKEKTNSDKHVTPPEDEKEKAENQDSESVMSNTDHSETEEKNKGESGLKNLKHHSHGGDTKTNDKHVDGAVWTISFSAWMCLSCSAIVLAGL